MLSKNTLKYGAIAGAIGIVFAIFLYMLGPGVMGGSMWAGMLIGLGSLVINISVLSYFGVQVRKDEGGYITFKKMFVNLLAIVVIMLVMGSLFSLLLFQVIDPEYMTIAKEKTLEAMYAAEDSMPEEAFNNALERIEEGFELGLGKTLKQIGWGIVGWGLFSLILAAILKKKEDFA